MKLLNIFNSLGKLHINIVKNLKTLSVTNDFLHALGDNSIQRYQFLVKNIGGGSLNKLLMLCFILLNVPVKGHHSTGSDLFESLKSNIDCTSAMYFFYRLQIQI